MSDAALQPATPPVTQTGFPVQTQPVTSVDPVQSQALDTFDQILTDLEQQSLAQSLPAPAADQSQPMAAVASDPANPLPQVLPGVIAQATQTLNPAQPVTGSAVKEAPRLSWEQQVAEIPGAQHVEQEVSPEISPEVEAYLQQVEQNQAQQPQEIVIADGSQPQMRPYQPPTPVVVLPITPEVEAAGAKKGAKFSVRWLVEWSRRIMKMFHGKVIYREA